MPRKTSSLAIQSQLRSRVSRFLSESSERRRPLREIVSVITREKWAAVLFGGVPRDLVLFGLSDEPRDVDIVIDDVNLSTLAKAFSTKLVRKTRFGGLNLKVENWSIDVWPLRDTWAFREGGVPVAGFRDLPRTTFLNVEAVAIDLTVEPGHARKIYSHGFLEAVRDRLLEINLEANPFPKLCVIRSFSMADRLNYAIGPKLARYVKKYGRSINVADIEDIQTSHYGFVRYSPGIVISWIKAVTRHVESGTMAPFWPTAVCRPEFFVKKISKLS